MEGEIIAKLAAVQSKLKAPKGQFNKFGGYSYRSAEDILEAVKPILLEAGAAIVIEDEMAEVSGRIYVKATATFHACGAMVHATAYAREEETKKGMDAAQITGSASSYARKYALNGLLLIDDTKDPDTRDNREPEAKPARPEPAKPEAPKRAEPKPADRLLTPDEITGLGKWAEAHHKDALEAVLADWGRGVDTLMLSEKPALVKAVKAAAKELGEKEGGK